MSTEPSKILDGVRVHLAIPTDYEPYNVELLSHINLVLAEAYQIGLLLPSWDYTTDSATYDTEWTEVFKPEVIPMAQVWLPYKVRQRWDPPQGSAATAISETIDALEGRMLLQVEGAFVKEEQD